MIKILCVHILVVCCLGCEKFNNTPPQADFSIFPILGDSLTVFIFNAEPSVDEETKTWQLKLRWEINDDDVWDTEFVIQKSFSWRFDSNGAILLVPGNY